MVLLGNINWFSHMVQNCGKLAAISSYSLAVTSGSSMDTRLVLDEADFFLLKAGRAGRLEKEQGKQ